MAGDERWRELEERYEGYAVYDRTSDEIGKVDDILVNGHGREEYIGVKLSSLWPRSTLIPVEAVRETKTYTTRGHASNQDGRNSEAKGFWGVVIGAKP